jgi:hypothetical protein
MRRFEPDGVSPRCHVSEYEHAASCSQLRKGWGAPEAEQSRNCKAEPRAFPTSTGRGKWSSRRRRIVRSDDVRRATCLTSWHRACSTTPAKRPCFATWRSTCPLRSILGPMPNPSSQDFSLTKRDGLPRVTAECARSKSPSRCPHRPSETPSRIAGFGERLSTFVRIPRAPLTLDRSS